MVLRERVLSKRKPTLSERFRSLRPVSNVELSCAEPNVNELKSFARILKALLH